MNTPPTPRVIRLAHDSPGRLRVRVSTLRGDQGAATALADAMAKLDGVREVEVRPRTGSVLCCYDGRRTDAVRLMAALRRHTHIATVRRDGEPLPSVPAGRQTGSTLGRAMVDLFRSLNADVTERTAGHLDLGALAGLGLLGAGAAEIAATRTIPAPPWFSLAWWAFRTFTMFEPAAIEPPAPRRAPRLRTSSPRRAAPSGPRASARRRRARS